MTKEAYLILIPLVPLAGAFLLPVLGRVNLRLRNAAALIMALVPFILSLCLIPEVIGAGSLVVRQNLPLGLSFVLNADALAVFMGACSSFISAIIIIYSFGYISHYRNQNEYYFLVVLFLGSMMGIVFSANLIYLYVFWEMTALISWRLIGFFRKKSDVLRADKAFLITAFGALVMLIAFINLQAQSGTFDLTEITASSRGFLSDISVILILFGILSKSATLPFHTWLPDAGVAPSPVTALLHAAVLVKIGVYVFARLFVATFNIDPLWHTVIPYLAAASAIISAGCAFFETDLKRIIAYSTISQIGFIFFGLAIGNDVGIAGGLLYILMHGLAKAGLFLCAGIVEQNTKTKDITKMGGLISTMPLTAFAFVFCAFSVMGIPPFGGFFSKYMVFMGGVASGNLGVLITFLLGAVLTILYLLRLFNMVFLGPLRIHAAEGSKSMVYSVVALGVISLAAGILVNYPIALIDVIVR